MKTIQNPQNINLVCSSLDVDTTAIDTGMDDLGKMVMERFAKQSDFDKNIEKYQERLSPYMYEAPKMSFYDLASELGAGLLSTPNTGGASAFTGLGVGFANAAQTMKRTKEDAAKARQQVGLQAAQLAMQDEQKANQFLNDYALKTIDNANKQQKHTIYQWKDEKGVTQHKRFAETPSNQAEINELVTQFGAAPVSPATTQINMGNKDSYADTKAIDQIFKDGTDFGAKAEASTQVQDQVDQAYILAQEVGSEGFGPFSRATLSARELISGLGFGNLLDDEDKIAPQKALNQLSMSFTMAIVSQTKGAISDREMKLFIGASPTLGSTYEGYLKQLSLVSRLAQRDSDFYDDWLNKNLELVDKNVSGQKKQIILEKFATNWKKENPLFTKEEAEELQKMVDDKTGLAEDFVPRNFQDAFDKRKKELTMSTSTSDREAVAKDVEGIPNGAVFERTVKNQAGEDVYYYRDVDGKLYTTKK